MSGEFKSAPTGANNLPSYQLFFETCAREQKSLAPGAPEKLDPNKAKVFNRSDGDGNFQVLYQDAEQDFVCAGQWHWPSQELLIRGGRLSQKSTRPLAGTRIPDACRATELLVGKSEFGGATCREGEDPLLSRVETQTSVKKFADYCSERLESYGNRRFALRLGQLFDLKQSRIENPVAGDGFYSLIFESRANQFVCEGFVDAGARQMILRSGSPAQFDQGEADSGLVFSMLDACSLTTELFGEGEIGVCKDQTERDRSIQDYVGFGVQAFLGVTSSYAFYRLSKRIWNTRALGFLRQLPFLRNLGQGALGYAAFDTVAGIFVGEDHPLRSYGAPAAGLAAMAAPELAARTAIGQRLLASSLGARALPWVSRFTWGFAAVGAVNWIAKKIMNHSDYDTSVKSRVTDRVYTDDGVYELEWWDLIPVHLALKGLRRGCRALAPDMMESAVSWDNESVEAEIRAEDKQHAAEAEEFLRQTLPLFLHAENSADAEEVIALLRDKVVEFSSEEKKWARAMEAGGYIELRSQFPDLSDDAAEGFCRKYLMKRAQEAAAFLRFVPGPENEWAEELFHQDGRLKAEPDAEGLLPQQRLKNRWPQPETEKSTITSEYYEGAPPDPAMA